MGALPFPETAANASSASVADASGAVSGAVSGAISGGPTSGSGADAELRAELRADVVRTFAPASAELLAELPAATRTEVEAAVRRARKAQDAWAVLPVEERAERVLRLRDAILERADEIIDVITRECGKPRHEALLHEVTTTLDLASHYCKHAARILAPRTIHPHLMRHRSSVVRYAPRGVIGVISPWNFPFVIPMGTVIAALVAGNGVVLKPSEVTPLVAMKAKEIYDSTGMPEDLFGLVVGHGDAGQALVDSGVDQIVFTGGVETGRRVAAACGARLIPCIMELGGKAPLLACADCDIERTARAIVFGGFANAGQACISVERVYAHADVHDALLARARELVSELRMGDPSRDYVDVGAITFPRQIELAERLVDDAVRKGAEVVIGGRKRAGAGQFFEPTLLAGCNHAMRVMTEEIFGPIVPFQRVDSDDEAVRLANDSPLGLNAYVFTRDRRRGQALAERIRAGSVVVNDVLSNYATAEAPFGGIKQSGFGRVHGDDELRALSDELHVSLPRIPTPAREPIGYPYTARSFHLAERAVKALFSRGIRGKLAAFF